MWVVVSDMVSRMMYNFPGITAGIDLDSDLIIDIAKTSPNVCGVKLTYVLHFFPDHSCGRKRRIQEEVP